MDINSLLGVNTLLELLVLVGLGAGGLLLKYGWPVLLAGLKSSAEKGAEIAVKNINWPRELAQELEKARGVERQGQRLESYGELWTKLRPLAIYDRTPFERAEASGLSKNLSDWYFSKCGGLFLTAPVREFYFALQDLLLEIGEVADWKAERFAGNHKAVFGELLGRENLSGAKEALDGLELEAHEWLPKAGPLARKWRADAKALGAGWSRFSAREQFAVLQRMGSALRTCMVNDVESRLR